MYITKNNVRHAPSQTEIIQHHNVQNRPESEIKNNLDTTLKTALIKFSENKVLTRDEALKMYAYFNCHISNIHCNELIYDDYVNLLSKKCISLKNIPSELLTYEICLQACKIMPSNLYYVPKHFLNAELYLAVCVEDLDIFDSIPTNYITKEFIDALPSLNYDVLFYIPDQLKSYSVYSKACQGSANSMRLIPKNHPNYKDFLNIVTETHGIYLEYFNKKQITPALCQQACLRDGEQLEYVPSKLKNFQLCEIATQSNYSALDHLPANLTVAEQKKLYELACSINFSALEYVPEKFKTEKLCLLAAKSGAINVRLLPQHLSQTALKQIFASACQHYYQDMSSFPEQFITQDLCHLNASHNGCAFSFIPEKFWNDEIWHQVKLHSSCSDHFLNYSLFNKFKHLINFIPKKTQLHCLLNPRLSSEQKLALIDFVDTHVYEANPIVNSNKVIETKSPLFFSVNNSFIYYLIENAYSVTPLNLRLLDLGKSLQHYISHSPLLPNNPFFNMQNMLTQYPREMVGGRTLAFNISPDNNFYIKFKKVEESIEELQKEGAVYSFINNDTYLKSKLKSDLPNAIFLEKIPLTKELEEQIKKSDDPIDIITEGNNRYVFALTFQASSNYARYAHLLDLGNKQGDFYHKPEQGILTACYDTGVLASMGMILPSLLPAFHDTSSNRRWIALHSAFKTSGIRHSGTFGAWNTTASARPDLGYGGIRDLGDHEMFGEIKTYLQQQETQMANQSYPDEVLQRLGFCNAICETLLSALIVRSRLQQQNITYHYTNKTCLNETKIFIENICNQFLTGFYDRESSASASLLQELLQLDDTKYTKWLERSALETVYWTAAQTGVDKTKFAHSSLEQDCYIKHIEKDGIASKLLYPDKNKIQRYDFFNMNGKLNLGANNTSFPLISFMNGLTLLCVNLLAKK